MASLAFDLGSLGRPQPWAFQDRGLEYPGEVVFAEAVDYEWGRSLEGEVTFRLVFFTVPRRIATDRIEDPRIAMAVPIRALHEVWQSTGDEIRSIHEARGRYTTGSDRDSAQLRRSMEEREELVRGELSHHYAAALSQGRVYTRTGISVRPRDVFVEDSPDSWAQRLASAVHRAAYPRLPFDAGAIPSPVTADAVVDLFRGLFQDDLDVIGALGRLGPPLGLTHPGAPTRFDAADCEANAILRRELDSAGGEMAGEEILRLLTLDHGLTLPLALLYLMAFVRQSRAELELGPDHGVEAREGGRFLSDRITWDLVPEIAFSNSLADDLAVLRLRPSITRSTVLPYVAALAGETTSGEPLSEVQARTASELSAATEGLRRLESALGAEFPGEYQTLERLQVLCDAGDHRSFYEAAQSRFQGPAGVRDALETLGNVRRVTERIPAITRISSYLGQMAFGPDHQDLLIQRVALAARLDPEGLMGAPSLWASIEAEFGRLRATHVRSYTAHHDSYYREAMALKNRLDGAGPQVEAVQRLHGMPELGEVVGVDVPALYEEVTNALRTCSREAGTAEPSEMPYCPECSLPLDEGVPSRRAALLFGALDEALREYNRILGSHAVRRVLADPTREQLDKFVDLVQVSDLSSLANVLDDDVVEFLRRFLKDG